MSPETFSLPQMKNDKLKIIIHRGAGASCYLKKLKCSIAAPDNSISAFLYAVQNNIKVVETDVLFIKDKLVIAHDKTKITENHLELSQLLTNVEIMNNLLFNWELKSVHKSKVSDFVEMFLSTVQLTSIFSLSTFDKNIYEKLIKHEIVITNNIKVFFIVDKTTFNQFTKIIKIIEIKHIVFDYEIINKMDKYSSLFDEYYMYGVELNRKEIIEEVININCDKINNFSGVIVDDIKMYKGIVEEYEDMIEF